MMSENSIINDRNVQLNVDGGFTVHYGSEHACGKQPNRLDITEGWNFVIRVYLPGESLLKREYKMPEVSVVQG